MNEDTAIPGALNNVVRIDDERIKGHLDRVAIASPFMQPSPNGRRVGIRIVTFEACIGFTRLRPVGLLSHPR